MNKKIILFALLLIYQYLLITTEDECSTFFESRKSTRCTAITLNTTHQCLYSNNKCYAFYKSCSSYTVGTGQKIDSKICSSIEASSADRICKVNEQDECVEDYRECKDYNGITLCPKLRAGTNQRCILFNGKCEAHYEKCEYITDKDKCGANIPVPSEYSNRYSKCFWDTTTDPSNPSCKPTDRTCSEYDTYKQFITCQDLKPKDTKKKCIYDQKNNKCYEGDGDCGTYEGNNRGDCQKYKHINSNNELLPLYKCDFNDDNQCVDSLKRCSDYKEGEDDGNCESFKTDNSAITKCVLEDKKCKEKYVSCEAYNSLDVDKRLETDCKAIKPLKSGTTSINNDVKCVMESNVCTEKNKECSEMTETTCEGHSLVGKPNKKCVLKDKKCIEQYNSCDNYNSNVEEDKKNEKDCTSIEDPSGLKCVFMNKNCIVEYTSCYNYNTEVDNDKKNEKDCTSIVESGLRCVFTPKSGETPAKCESKNYECSDLNFDTLKSTCINHNINSITQECTYNKGVCTKTAKKCKNIIFDINETDKSKEGICNSAPTEGSNKICTLNKDKDGCIEQDKPKQSESSSQDNDDNSGNEKYLNKILIFILCLLL